MKKLLLSLALLLVICDNGLSQCIILDVKLNDCVSCYKNVTVLDELSSTLPVFAVFSENRQEDSIDLEYKLSLSKYHIQYVFNNKLYKRFHRADTTSNWYVLDHNGQTVMDGDLKTMDKGIVVDSINELVERLPSCRHCHFKFTKDRMYFLDGDINKLQSLWKGDLGKIFNASVRTFDFKDLAAGLSNDDRLAFEEKGSFANSGVTGFKPAFEWFDIAPSGGCYVLLSYTQPFKKGGSFDYEPETCMIQYDAKGRVKKTFPVNFDSAKKYDNFSARFVMKDDLSFLAITHDPMNWFDSILQRNPDEQIRFLTDYTLNERDGVFTPTKQYPIDLPVIHKKKYFENDMSPELCDFPYISLWRSNEVYDLNTNISFPVVEQSVYQQYVDMNSKEKDKYMLMRVSKEINGKGVFIVYRLDEDIYIKHFDKEMKETKVVLVANVLKGENVRNCFIDPYSAQLYFTFDVSERLVSVPLAVYGF